MLMRSTGPLAGRKIVFCILDGFVMDIKRSKRRDVMQRVANEAARAGAVVHPLDTRANFFGPGADVPRNDYPDSTGGTAWRSLAENKAPQEPLETLADEPGGGPDTSTNPLATGLSRAL